MKVRGRHVCTPECDKLSAVHEASQKCGEFLDWLERKGLILCSVPEGMECTWLPVHHSKERLLAEFFGIDLDRVEAEKRAILNALRGEG